MSDCPPFWFYIDESDEIQGPYDDASLREWFADAFFTLNTQIRAAFSRDETCDDKREFVAIGKRTDFFTKTQILEIQRTSPQQSLVQEPEIPLTTPPTSLPHLEQVDTQPMIQHDVRQPLHISQLQSSTSWYYVDKQGKEQGPFSTDEMKQWWDYNFFTPSLQIRGATMPGKPYFTIESLPQHIVPFLPTFSAEFAKQQQTLFQSSSQQPPQQQPQHETAWYYLSESYFYVAQHQQKTYISHGPFSQLQMRYWFAKGYFTYGNTLIATEADANILAVDEWNRLTHSGVSQNDLQRPEGFYPATSHPLVQELMPPNGPVSGLTSDVTNYIASFHPNSSTQSSSFHRKVFSPSEAGLKPVTPR